VYVLERRRAVEVWNTLMGDIDPLVARENTPNSLRALYGISKEQNGLMGSPDSATAELQIQALFASSPPFPTTDLPEDGSQFNTLESATSSLKEALRRGSSYGRSTGNGTPGANGGFRARAVPTTNVAPDIAPRTTKAAALRAGILQDKSKTARYELHHKARDVVPKEQRIQQFMNVPGHKRSETIAVASTAAPTVAPRLTKAALLRMGVKDTNTASQPPRGRPSSVQIQPKRPALAAVAKSDESVKKTNSFEGVPGHKRRESIAVASTAVPTVAPRTNRSAALRAQKEAAPPSSFMCTSLFFLVIALLYRMN
jgi:hypothetical protein